MQKKWKIMIILLTILIILYALISCEEKIQEKKANEDKWIVYKQLEEKEPLPDKEADQMAWVRAANQHRAIAEEIILKELIYV